MVILWQGQIVWVFSLVLGNADSWEAFVILLGKTVTY